MGDSVLVCKKCKNSQCLVGFLKAKTELKVVLVGCQKICHGPVIGLGVAGRMEWFERVGKAKAMVSLGRLTAEGGKVPKALEKRRVTTRSGRAPR